MKRKFLFLMLMTVLSLSIVSCNKEPSNYDLFYNSIHASSHGEEKKVDIKGSLMNGDMRSPNIEVWLSGSTLYVCFYETIEECLMLVSAENGDLLFSRRMAKQYPSVVRVFMGSEPSGNYHLQITNGVDEADADFHFENTTIKHKKP